VTPIREEGMDEYAISPFDLVDGACLSGSRCPSIEHADASVF
jgi:hypothetical protein